MERAIMKLKELIRKFPELKVMGSKEVEITGITADSRIVSPGNLFVAKKGSVSDGTEFIAQAVAAGASAILTPIYNPFLKQTQILCEQPQAWEARLAAHYYRNPSRDLWIAGVTGSKGKTTTTYLLRHLLMSLGRPCGLIGTIEKILSEEKRFPSTMATHDAISNQKLLREMANNGCESAILEVSSHGLAQKRVEEIAFDLALFTNLYPDHLDYHKTIEAYASEKRKLFETGAFGIYNADSPWTPFMKEDRAGLTFGIEAEADVRADAIRLDAAGGSFTVQGERFFVPFMGRFNISNVLGAIAVGIYLKVDLAKLASIFAKTPPVPGRLEQVPNDLGIRVFVDYAHMGEALEYVLKTLREIAPKKIIVVFGCGGGRDPARRLGMGAAAAKWADLSIVTSDNARDEDPQEICSQILAAFEKGKKVITEIDRAKAIRLAIQLAEAGDLVLIAGKGHERVQIFAHQSMPFDDLAVAKQELQIRQSSAILSSS